MEWELLGYAGDARFIFGDEGHFVIVNIESRTHSPEFPLGLLDSMYREVIRPVDPRSDNAVMARGILGNFGGGEHSHDVDVPGLDPDNENEFIVEHLEGTANDHDQSDHAGGSRRRRTRRQDNPMPNNTESDSENMERRIAEDIRAALIPDSEGEDSVFQHYDFDGNMFEDMREDRHDMIIEDALEGATPVAEPIAYFLGGGPASGKSSVARSGLVTFPENIVVIDSDDIKGQLPEYQDRVAAGDNTAAAFVHEESSYLSKVIHRLGTREDYNTLLDGTGDGSIEGLAAKVQAARDQGQETRAVYVTVPTEEAVQRAQLRAQNSGREVPESAIRRTHAAVSAVVPLAIERGLFDSFELYDTEVPLGSPPRIVARAMGTNLTIENPELWERFLRKADANN